MLQSFRENIKGVTAVILVGLLIIPFAFFGVESLFVSGTSVEQVATVNGSKITQLELDRNLEFQKQRLLSRFEDMDPALLDDERLRAPVLNQLIQQKLLTQTAAEQGMAVSDKTFNEMILGNDAFIQDGRFDEELYRYHLTRLGYTPLSYRESVKEEMLANHLSAGIQATAFASPKDFKDFARLALQTRSFDYVTLSQNDVSDIQVTREEIASYYDENREALTEPDMVIVDYIELSPDLLRSRMEPDEQVVDQRLAQARESARTEGKTWRLAHILIEPGEDSGQSVDTVEQRLAEGEAFAELAREFSADFGSAESGGELGTFTADALPPGFAGAIEGLEEGGVTGPVELESGIHFIKLLEVTGERVRATVTREQVERELKAEMAQEQLPAVLERLKEETFSVDALAAAGERLGLPVKTSDPFPREGDDGISRYPAVVKAAFSRDVLEEGFASEALELGENHYAVIKLREFIPAHLPPLEEVSDRIEDVVRIRKAQAALKERAAKLQEKLASGESLARVASGEGLTVQSRSDITRFDQRIPPGLGEAVFEPPLSRQTPIPGMSTALNGDVTLFVITAMTAGSLDDLSGEERRSLWASLAQASGAREFNAFLETLQADAEITRSIGTAE